MRHGYLLIVAGCGFHSPAEPDDDDPDLVAGTWSFATGTELAAPGHAAVDMAIDARGSLTPDAFVYGGLVGHGMPNIKLWMHGDTSWAKLDPTKASGAGLWRGEELDAAGALEFLGIPSNMDEFTLWFEGEVWLEAGSTEEFTLSGDDVAFIELAQPGTATFAPLLESPNTIKVPAPVAGWYPIRIGYAVADGIGGIRFTHSDAGEAPAAWTRARLRARTGALRGTLHTVFTAQILGGGAAPTQQPVSSFHEGDLLASGAYDPTPQGAPENDWSERFAGQLYVTTPGLHTLQTSSDDGNRARLGSVVQQTHWGRDLGVGDTPGVTTVTANLAAGWNDLVIDHNEASGEQTLEIKLQRPGQTSFDPISRAMLRPVEAVDERLAVAGDDTRREINENSGVGETSAILNIAGYPGETVAAIDVTCVAESDDWSQIHIDLEAPGGVRRMIRPRESGDRDGARAVQLTIGPGGDLSALLGGPSHGEWKLHVVDGVPQSNETALRIAKLTLHTTGGPKRVAPRASWTSAVLDTVTPVRTIESVTWNQRVPDGATIDVKVGTCEQADCSDGPAWSPSATIDAPLSVTPGRYLQVRVEMTSNGDLEPELSGLAVTYRRDPD